MTSLSSSLPAKQGMSSSKDDVTGESGEGERYEKIIVEGEGEDCSRKYSFRRGKRGSSFVMQC